MFLSHSPRHTPHLFPHDDVLAGKCRFERRMVLEGVMQASGERRVITNASMFGDRTGPPAERLYAVEPVGVATITPSATYVSKSSSLTHTLVVIIFPRFFLPTIISFTVRLLSPEARESSPDEASVRFDGDVLWQAETGDEIHISQYVVQRFVHPGRLHFGQKSKRP